MTPKQPRQNVLLLHLKHDSNIRVLQPNRIKLVFTRVTVKFVKYSCIDLKLLQPEPQEFKIQLLAFKI